MMYTENYINSFTNGVKNSQFKIKGTEVSQEIFFDESCNLINTINQNSGRIFFFGNGASEAFSNHMALDWTKNGKIISYSLSDSALLTALSNDYSYEDSFKEYLKIYKANSKDLVITTSSSGNSSNIVNVLNYCNENLIKTYSMSGLKIDNFSFNNSYYSIYVPTKTYGMVECIHQYFHHLLLDKFMNISEWTRKESQNMDSKNFKL